MNEVAIVVDGSKMIVTAPAGKRGEVAGVLLGAVDDAHDIVTVTGVEHGLGFKLDARYRDVIHAALFDGFAPGGIVPNGPFPEVDRIDLDDNDDVVPATTDDNEPPRGGKGSGRDVWAEFLDVNGIDYTTDHDRDDLITLWDTRNDNDN